LQNPDTDVDARLLERFRAGDDRAASELVERHAQALARFAVSLGEREEVEELVQDTFVRAFGSLDSFRGESSLRTWLFTIERRLILDRRRSLARHHARFGASEVDAVRERLPDLLHERLPAVERERVLAHVRECAECAAELAWLRSAREALTSATPRLDASAIARAVRAQLEPVASPRLVVDDGGQASS